MPASTTAGGNRPPPLAGRTCDGTRYAPRARVRMRTSDACALGGMGREQHVGAEGRGGMCKCLGAPCYLPAAAIVMEA